MSSCHLLLGRPLDLFPLLGCHSVQRLVHLLSFILAICPARLHFCFSVYYLAIMIVVVYHLKSIRVVISSSLIFFLSLYFFPSFPSLFLFCFVLFCFVLFCFVLFQPIVSLAVAIVA